MDLQEAYKSWQKNNVDEHLHMVGKKKLKPRTIELWTRKLEAWKARQKKQKDNSE